MPFVISKYIVSVHVGVAQYDVKTHVWYHKNLYGKIFLRYFRWAMLAKILWNSWWSMKKTIRWSKAYQKKKIRSVTKRIASFCEWNYNLKDYLWHFWTFNHFTSIIHFINLFTNPLLFINSLHAKWVSLIVKALEYFTILISLQRKRQRKIWYKVKIKTKINLFAQVNRITVDIIL